MANPVPTPLTERTADGADLVAHKNCPICFEDFKVGEKISYHDVLHIFHSSCLDQWRERHNTCPNCRASIGYKPIQGIENAGVLENPAPAVQQAAAAMRMAQERTLAHIVTIANRYYCEVIPHDCYTLERIAQSLDDAVLLNYGLLTLPEFIFSLDRLERLGYFGNYFEDLSFLADPPYGRGATREALELVHAYPSIPIDFIHRCSRDFEAGGREALNLALEAYHLGDDHWKKAAKVLLNRGNDEMHQVRGEFFKTVIRNGDFAFAKTIELQEGKWEIWPYSNALIEILSHPQLTPEMIDFLDTFLLRQRLNPNSANEALLLLSQKNHPHLFSLLLEKTFMRNLKQTLINIVSQNGENSLEPYQIEMAQLLLPNAPGVDSSYFGEALLKVVSKAFPNRASFEEKDGIVDFINRLLSVSDPEAIGQALVAAIKPGNSRVINQFSDYRNAIPDNYKEQAKQVASIRGLNPEDLPLWLS